MTPAIILSVVDAKMRCRAYQTSQSSLPFPKETTKKNTFIHHGSGTKKNCATASDRQLLKYQTPIPIKVNDIILRK